MSKFAAVLCVSFTAVTASAQSTFSVDEAGLISFEVAVDTFASGVEISASGDLFAAGPSPFGFVLGNTPTKVTLASIPDLLLPAGTIPTEVTWSGSDDSLEVILGTAGGVNVEPVLAHLFGEVENQDGEGTLVDFGKVVQGDAESSLRTDVLNVHAAGWPFLVEQVRINGTATDVFDVPDFQVVTVNNGEFATFDLELDVDAAPGRYQGSIEFFSEGEQFPWWSLFRVKVQILHPGDCNADGAVDGNDLACISTIEQRDIVLTELNTLPGDLDGNGDVSLEDYLTLSNNFGGDLLGYSDGNIDLEGGIDFADYLILSENFGANPGAAAVPEPDASIAVFFGLACLSEVTRRRVR